MRLIEQTELFRNEDVAYRMENNIIYTRYPHSHLETEIFFALKNTMSYKGIPSSLYFYCTKYMQTQYPLSYLPKILPDFVFKELTSGYFKNPIGLISNIIGRQFNVITHENLYVNGRQKGTLELYILSTDRIAIIPEDLINKLTITDIQNIYIRNNILYVGNKPLHALCGKYGIYKKGLYDLNAVT